MCARGGGVDEEAGAVAVAEAEAGAGAGFQGQAAQGGQAEGGLQGATGWRAENLRGRGGEGQHILTYINNYSFY